MNRTISDELLQRYHDGELTAAERADVEARLDADARLRLEALSELGGLLRGHSTYEAAQIDFSSTIAAIEKRAPVAAAKPARRSLVPVSAMGLLAASAMALFFFVRPVGIHNDAHIESLEVTGSAPATVMQMPDENDPSHTTTVIWATLDDDGKGEL